ncbi:DnaB-like helicase N-terminal domain-containing protein [Candidatus Latescibacterota bacterium]
MKDNEIPQSPDIERTVLGYMIFENVTIPMVVNAGEGLFYKPQHQGIFKAINALYTENGNIDQLTLTEQLIKDGNIDNVCGEATIVAICSETASTAFIGDHLKILKEKAAVTCLTFKPPFGEIYQSIEILLLKILYLF